jgi:cell division protein FtsW
MIHRKIKAQLIHPYFDGVLLCTLIALISIGFLAVASSSIVLAEQSFGAPFYFTIHQFIHILLGIFLLLLAWHIPLSFWQSQARWLLLLSAFLLTIVFIPGVGRTFNGATRWIFIGPISIQGSEVAKLSMIIYFAYYIARFKSTIKHDFITFLKPMILLSIICILLLLEPDFGACVVITSCAMTLLFMSGAPWRWFLSIICLVGLAFAGLIASAPYRLERLTSFLNPWADQFDSGYQLTQALIAFGRGSLFGVGLGSSIQKQFYLPEAHSDFVFAIIAEETGLVGSIVVLLLYALFGYRAFKVSMAASEQNQTFGSLIACGIGLWITLQAFINIGVNSGLLPTKGLTLPLISAGGSSMLIIFVAIGLLLRVDYESRC